MTEIDLKAFKDAVPDDYQGYVRLDRQNKGKLKKYGHGPGGAILRWLHIKKYRERESREVKRALIGAVFRAYGRMKWRHVRDEPALIRAGKGDAPPGRRK